MFSATDPQGRLVLLDQETWDKHIVNRHPDVVPDWIAETITDPDIIAKDQIKRPRVRCTLCYYRYDILPRAYGKQLFKVIAFQRKRNRTFHVKSAYPADHVKLREEEVIWTRLTPSSSSEPT